MSDRDELADLVWGVEAEDFGTYKAMTDSEFKHYLGLFRAAVNKLLEGTK
jgi:hypothetical protein